ncbi:uncharacterized protein [Arachis hypogaea]|uniref:uncharacterized protein n=1 Tax=Arachis hypogaea TaxID=3818 RepID=UPI000DED3166|nr:uncharacterized protein LOC112775956 [Arachis hypogaea]
MQEMFSMYIESRGQISFIEVYVEFEPSETDRNIEREDYNSDSEEEFESNYEVVGPDGDEDQGDSNVAPNVADVANALANEHLFEESSFMRDLDLKTMHAPEFSEYMNAEIPFVADGEFAVGMKFSCREAVIRAMKDYTIQRGVDYRVYESEPLPFYAKCTQYGSGCDWLIMVSLMSKKYCWVIRRYNGSHTCTRATISQDHSKLDSNTIAEAIKPLVEADPSILVKSIIAEVQSKFNYTVSYRKAWLAKQKAFRHCKPVVQVDGTHLYGKYKGCPLVAVLQDENNNIVPIAFGIVEGETSDAWHIESNFLRKFKGCPLVAVSQDENNNIVPIAFGIVEGETSDAWYFILSNLRQHVVTQDGVGLISDRHESINAAVARSNGAWSPPKAFHMFFIRHIESNFLRKFKAPYLQKLVVNIGYSKTVCEYELHYQRLRERGEAYTTWLNRISREQYALAFDSGYRWGHMTTNLVECINSVLKGVHNLPTTALMKATFYRLNELFT